MDRPIKSKGYYDMNFIDWNNEWENIVNSNYENLDDNKECPIYGMDIITFNELIKKDFEQAQLEIEEQIEIDDGEKKGLSSEQLEKIQQMKMGKTSQECSICMFTFSKGQMILRLPVCQHIFHKNCVIKWLQKNSTCPNCRLDLQTYFKNK